MIGSKKIGCVIPARLKSTRFPKKMLSILKGKPMLQWIWEKANAIPFIDHVIIAVDSELTAQLVQQFQGKYYMTAQSCLSGTDRLIEVMQSQCIQADIWINWQGDEPFVCQEMIVELLQTCTTDHADLWTLRKKIINLEEAHSPHVVKVVCDCDSKAIYFSRSMIPFYRDMTIGEHFLLYKHIGLYAYTQYALERITTFLPCELEMAEQLEQLRFLYHRLHIGVHETAHETWGIDLPEHLAKAEQLTDLDLLL